MGAGGWGVDGCRNKSQQGKLTLEKKILPQLNRESIIQVILGLLGISIRAFLLVYAD